MSEEEPEDWRSLYAERFGKGLNDSCQTVICRYDQVDKALIPTKNFQLVFDRISQISIKSSSLINMNFGACDDYCAMVVYAMRSLGVPTAIGYLPHWGGGGVGHSFNVFMDENGHLMSMGMGAVDPKSNFAKLYQDMYAVQKGSLAMIHGNEPIPELFQNPYMKDISEELAPDGVTSLTFDLSKQNVKHSFIYLCVFDIADWFPVAWSKTDNGQAQFPNVGKKVLYQLAEYSAKGMQTIGYPFFLNEEGGQRYFIPDSDTLSLRLERKCKMSGMLQNYAGRIIGGTFQVADNPAFNHPVVLHTFTEPTDMKWHTLQLPENTNYRYFRYLSGPNGQCNMAELELFDQNNQPLSGQIIGTDGSCWNIESRRKEAVFDGDPLTFYDAWEMATAWAGLDLGEVKNIKSIRYIFRNDDNGIRKGQKYELFYMDKGGWKSLGSKIADQDDEIFFERVPSGALYWLRNRNKGHEEAPFSYENGRQVFW